MLRLAQSFRYALQGLQHCYQTQANFRLELLLGSISLLLAVWLEVSPTPIVLCCALVLSLEMLNTALETLCNAVTLEQNPQIKIAKDVAAGAVLLVSYAAILVGVLEFMPALRVKFGI
jgi:diacylglycerol kinase (ATP)